MKKSILATLASFMLLLTSFAEPIVTKDQITIDKISTINFSVVVSSGGTTIDGAKVTVLQNGATVSSGTTMRGKAQVYIENKAPFQIRVEKKGYKTFKKDVPSVSSGQQMNVTLIAISAKK